MKVLVIWVSYINGNENTTLTHTHLHTHNASNHKLSAAYVMPGTMTIFSSSFLKKGNQWTLFQLLLSKDTIEGFLLLSFLSFSRGGGGRGVQ